MLRRSPPVLMASIELLFHVDPVDEGLQEIGVLSQYDPPVLKIEDEDIAIPQLATTDEGRVVGFYIPTDFSFAGSNPSTRITGLRGA